MLHAAVDVQRLAGQPPRVRRREERAGEADVHDVDQFADRRALRGLVEQQVEVLEAGRGARLERPRRDGVHADALAARARRRGSGSTPRARPSPAPSRCSSARPCSRRDSSSRTSCRRSFISGAASRAMRTNEWHEMSIAFAKPSAEQLSKPALQVLLRRPRDRVHEDVEPAPVASRSASNTASSSPGCATSSGMKIGASSARASGST